MSILSPNFLIISLAFFYNIDVNTKLYELSKGGYISEGEIGEFFPLAYQVYEAY